MNEQTPVLKDVTCIMSIYLQDQHEWVREAINSILMGTRLPGEFLIYYDGPVSPKVEWLLEAYTEGVDSLVRVFKGEQNRGRAYARQYLINQAKGEYIMMMDADDVSLPDRLEKEYKFLHLNPDIDVVGGWIEEFGGGFEARVRKVPVSDEDIRRRGKFLQPLNHVTLLVKKEVILDVGGYQDSGACEDYFLIARWLVTGKRLQNLPKVLVLVRTPDSFLSRRRGISYYRDEMVIYRYLRETGYISVWEFLFISLAKFIVRLLPHPILSGFYGLLRSSKF